MNFLDVRTVLFSSIITGALCAAVMNSLWQQNRRRSPELAYWLADFILQFAGILLIALRGILPEVVSVLFGVPCSLLGALLMLLGLERYTGKTKTQRYNFLLLAIFTLVHGYFIYVQPSLTGRNLNYSLGLLAFCGQCAWLLLHRVDIEMRLYTRTVGVIFTAYGLVSLLRIFVDLAIPPTNDLFKSGLYDTLAILIYQILLISLIFTLFLMINRRLFTDLEGNIAERKQAEAALKKSKEKFSVAFHNIPDAIVITSIMDGRIIEANEGLFRIAGFTVEESIGKTTLELNLWGNLADRERFAEELNKYGQVLNFEAKFQKKSGELITGSISGELIQLQGQVCILNVIQNVTARKQTEAALKESEANFRALVENAGEGILITAQGGIHLFANRAIAEISGYSVAELLNLKMQELSHPDEVSMVTERLQKRLAGELVSHQYETDILSKNGRKVPVEISSNETTWQGQPAAIIFVKDITERKQAENALRDSQAQVTGIFNSAMDAILTVDEDQKIIIFNPSAEQMFGCPASEAIGQTLDRFLPEYVRKDHRGYLRGFGQSISSKRSMQTPALAVTCLRANGQAFASEVSISQLELGGRRLYTAIVRDITERKRVEDALRQERILLRTVIDNLPDAIYTKDSGGRKTLTNRVDLENIGAANEVEILGKTDWELFPEDVAARFDADDQAVLQSGQPVLNREEFLVNLHGQEHWLLTSKLPLRNESGSIVGLLGIGHDITARKQAEEILRESERKLREAQEMAHLGFWSWEVKTGKVEWSEEVFKIFGLDPQEFTPQIDSILALSPWPEDHQRDQELINRAIETHDPGSYEQKFLRPDQSIGYYYSTFQGNYAENGALISIVGTVLDITARKQAEEKLLASEVRYRRLFEAAKDGILILDAETGIIVDVNPFLVEMLGFPREEILGKELWELGFFKDIAANKANFLELQQEEYIRYEDLPLETANGKKLSVEFVSNVYQVDHHKVVQCNLRDMTERKLTEQKLAEYSTNLAEMVDERTRELRETQEQLVRQERLATLGQVAGSIGHELRNPLGVISNAVYYLKAAQPEASQKVKEYLEMIEKETRTSDKIITDLLDFTRIKALDRQPGSVSELVAQTLERYPAPAPIQVTLEIPAHLPQIYADPRHVVQVFGNLVTNACQAMETGGKLTISAAVQSDMICISINDNGLGIPPENLAKLFQPLFTTKTKGIGLGLAVSKKLAEANGGKIEVESLVGQGSRFTVCLPVYKE